MNGEESSRHEADGFFRVHLDPPDFPNYPTISRTNYNIRGNTMTQYTCTRGKNVVRVRNLGLRPTPKAQVTLDWLVDSPENYSRLSIA